MAKHAQTYYVRRRSERDDIQIRDAVGTYVHCGMCACVHSRGEREDEMNSRARV